MHKSATKCNETIGKWCKNKHEASKIIDTLETYQPATGGRRQTERKGLTKRPPCKQKSTCHISSTGNSTTNREAGEPFSAPLAATVGQRGKGGYHATASAATPREERGPDRPPWTLCQHPQATTARGTRDREKHQRRPTPPPPAASDSSGRQIPSLSLPTATAGRRKKTGPRPSQNHKAEATNQLIRGRTRASRRRLLRPPEPEESKQDP
jgi:hypothetical protein